MSSSSNSANSVDLETSDKSKITKRMRPYLPPATVRAAYRPDGEAIELFTVDLRKKSAIGGGPTRRSGGAGGTLADASAAGAAPLANARQQPNPKAAKATDRRGRGNRFNIATPNRSMAHYSLPLKPWANGYARAESLRQYSGR